MNERWKQEKLKSIYEEFLASWHVPDPGLRAVERVWWRELRAGVVSGCERGLRECRQRALGLSDSAIERVDGSGRK